MKRYLMICFSLAIATHICAADMTPSLLEVFDRLGLEITLDDEIRIEGVIQGVFVQVEEGVKAYPVSINVDQGLIEKSRIRVGYYLYGLNTNLRALFECDDKANGQSNIHGLPTRHNLPIAGFDPKSRAFGFFLQSEHNNARFSADSETLFSQSRLNIGTQYVENSGERIRIFPYRINGETKENWYVVCWDFSGKRTFSDLVMVIRGASPVFLLPQDEEELETESQSPRSPRDPRDGEIYAIT